MSVQPISLRARGAVLLALAASVTFAAPQDGSKDPSKEVNDPASLQRRLDFDFNFLDSKALGTISTFAPALTVPISQRGKLKVIVPLTGSMLSRNLELGDLAVGYVHIP